MERVDTRAMGVGTRATYVGWWEAPSDGGPVGLFPIRQRDSGRCTTARTLGLGWVAS